MPHRPPDVTTLTVALVLFASGTRCDHIDGEKAQKWPRSGVRICARVNDVMGTCSGKQMDYCFWTNPAVTTVLHRNSMGCYDCEDTLEKCKARADFSGSYGNRVLNGNKKDSDYVCNYDTSVVGIPNLLVPNGFATGYSSKSCDDECSSNPECKSFVFRPKDGYCALWSTVSPSKYSAGSGYVHCVSTVDTCVDDPGRQCSAFLVSRDRCEKKFALGQGCTYCESHPSFTKGCQHSCHACPGEANYPLWLTLTRSGDPKTTVTTSTGTTTTLTTTITHSPGDCRANDSNCNDCDMSSGACFRCRNSNYLLNGVCGAESSCTAAGLFPVGKASGGRACVAEGGLCGMPGCKPTLTACVASRVGPGGEEVCEACSRETFLVDGGCKYRLTCKGPQFDETDAKCTCRHRKEEGGAVEKNCHRCHTYGSQKEGSYAALGPAYKHTFVKCYGCSGGYFFKDGHCITKGECPSTMVAYEGRNGYKNFCEPPFACDGGKKQSGLNKGQSCECKENNCAACDWRAGSEGHTCTQCKRKQYFLNGTCVSSPDCIASGGVPLGSKSHGRVCSK